MAGPVRQDAAPGLPTLAESDTRGFGAPPPRHDARLAASLAAIGRGFAGYAAISVTDLGRGRTASWNAAARFPAASTAKLGLLAAALRRFHGRERAQVAHDLRAIATWSSNLAANRLAARLGDPAIEVALDRLGAAATSYAGVYRVGTRAARQPAEPPLVSQRVTTAADLDAALRTLLRVAAGWKGVAARSGLRPADARTAIGLLARADRRGDNAGLVAPFAPPGVRVAQKNGWISSARHTAAVVLGARGPVVIVVLTYREGLSLTDAQALGARVVRAALR